jgi:hypothetical protein
MLGQHPQMYGLPEMNLFVVQTMAEWWAVFQRGRHFEGHGLLRAVAQLFYGEQTEETIQLARRWLWCRLHLDTSSVFKELTDKAHPLMLVDKSPYYVSRFAYLQRLLTTFPGAKFLHLVRHPRGHRESVIGLLIESGLHPARIRAVLSVREDPGQRWYLIHQRIRTFLSSLPEQQKMWLRGEDLLTDPDRYLREITTWLRLRTDAEAIEQMKHPERSPFAHFGPLGAHLGHDPHFLQQPVLRPHATKLQSLEGPLSWREDGVGFSTPVKRLAREFGYKE